MAGPMAALLIGALAMAISPILVRLADVGPFASAFWRVFLALPVLWAWTSVAERNGAAGPRQRSFSKPVVVAGLLFTGDICCWHLAVVHTTVANATFFATTAPVWVVLFGWLLFRERVTRLVMAGLALCLFGGVMLVVESVQVDLARVPGDLLGLLTGVFFGAYFLAVREARGQAGAARVTFELTIIASALLLVAALTLDHGLLPHTARGWVVLFCMAWISHAAGQGLLSIALGRLPAVFSSLVIFLEAIIAAVLAWIILGEALTPVQALGGACIVGGIWIARPRPAAAPGLRQP